MLVRTIHQWLRSVMGPSKAVEPAAEPVTVEESAWIPETRPLGTDALGTRWVLDLGSGRVRAVEPTGTVPAPQDWLSFTRLHVTALAEAFARGGHCTVIEEKRTLTVTTPAGPASVFFQRRMLVMMVAFEFRDFVPTDDRRRLANELNAKALTVRWINDEADGELLAEYDLPCAAGVSVQQLLAVFDEFVQGVRDGTKSEQAAAMLHLGDND